MKQRVFDPTRLELLHGRDEPPAEGTALRAGPVELSFLGDGDLRRIRAGDSELVRRIFVTVRDKDWLEVPPTMSSLAVDARESSFEVSFSAAYRSGPLDATLGVSFVGDEEGSITCLVDGAAHGRFLFCRIGLCVLHPPSCAGRVYRALTPEGPVVGTLPERIGVQEVDGVIFRGLFAPFERLTIEQGEGVEIGFAFEGDLFEMEDQRNWTDGSFKTYCTPGSLGYPFQAELGMRFQQRVVITPSLPPTWTATRKTDTGVTIEVGGLPDQPFPKLGVAAPDHEIDDREVALLRALDLEHLKVAVELTSDSAGDILARAARTALALEAEIELAVFLSDEADGGFHRLRPSLEALGAGIARILVFRNGEETTTAASLRLARDGLDPFAPGVSLVGGTNLYFTELNRTRPDTTACDAVSWTINPQIHAYDEVSLVETLEMQGETVRSARSFCGDLPLVVSGVTLRPPFNADAMEPGEPAAPPEPGQLPPTVDRRQMSLFGAVWTLGSFTYLAEAGVASVTYYEATGWRGLIETATGSDPAVGFRSFPRMVFPLYHVLADIADLRTGSMLPCLSSNPLRAVGLAAVSNAGTSLLVGNLEPQLQDVTVHGLPRGYLRVRTLDEDSALLGARNPSRYRSSWSRTETDFPGGRVSLRLGGYGVGRIEVLDAGTPIGM